MSATQQKLEKLTPEQEAMMPIYVKRGIEIGLATGPDFDVNLVRDLTDKHRIMCDKQKADYFEIYDSPAAACAAIPSLSPSTALYGQHDISWLIYYEFFRKECGIQGLDKIQYLLELCNHVGWMWMSDNATIVTRRPEQIHLMTIRNASSNSSDNSTIRVLHNLNGLALQYRDGTGVYACRGTRIPTELGKKFVEVPADSLDPQEVMSISNTEIRTEIMLKIGIERLFKLLSKKSLDREILAPGGEYELFQVEIGNRNRLYLTGKCPSNEESFYEAVHPDCKTVRQALSFRNFGKIEVPFVPPVTLT